MNINNTIFPNIGNRNTTSHDVDNEDASSMSSRVSKVTSEIAEQKGISFIPQYSRLRDEHNGVHSNQHKRTVDLKGAETYRIPSDRGGVACHESVDSNNNTENILGSREWPIFTETVKSFFTSLVPQMKEGCKAFAWDPKPKVIAASLFSFCFPEVGVVGKTFITFCAMVGGAAATGAGSEVNTTPSDKVKSSNNTIGINDIEMLEKIGKDKNFPSDGNYELMVNLDAINFTQTIVKIAGDFNGKNHTISNMERTLVWEIQDGRIRNLTISNANIHYSNGCLAVLACFVTGDSRVSHVQVEDSQMKINRNHGLGIAGMVISELLGSSQIDNVLVKNCTIEAERLFTWVGFLVGLMSDTSKSSHNTVDGGSIISYTKKSEVGALIGSMLGGTLSSNDKVTNCRIEIKGIKSTAGGAVGYLEANTKITNVEVSESRVEGNGDRLSVGIVVGRSDEAASCSISIFDSRAINSSATVMHESSKVGIWVGRSFGNIQSYNNTDINCTIESPALRTTTAANLTTTEPAMIVDDVSSLSVGVLLAGVTITATTIGLTGCFAYSLYNGYQEGKRGRSLAMHPFASFGKLLNNCCKSFTGYQPFGANNREEEMILMDEMVSI